MAPDNCSLETFNERFNPTSEPIMKIVGILKNHIQEYSWGSKTALSEFLGRPSHIKLPMAELWMGAHPKSPSEVICDGQTTSLSELIENNPIDLLGSKTAEKFNNKLPFLFKVLAADQPLSIQAHPNLAQAKDGFIRENNLHIPLDAPNRNYKDENHKPEIICALTTFWALNGFRPISEITEILKVIKSPALNKISNDFFQNQSREGLSQYLITLFKLEKEQFEPAITETIEYCRYHVNHNPLFGWMIKFNDLYPGDIGILTSILLNLICLAPGEAMFLQPGQLHTYLKGMGIELMANSDNVLRGGLTPKHIDSDELLTILNFEETPVNIYHPQDESDAEKIFYTPAEEFQLSVINVYQNTSYISSENREIELIICTLGFADFVDISDDTSLQLTKGDSIIIPAALKQYKIAGNAVLYKASVPL